MRTRAQRVVIPAADLDELNAKIEVVAEYWPPGESGADA